MGVCNENLMPHSLNALTGRDDSGAMANVGSVFQRMIKMQIIATVLVAVVAYILLGFNAGISALAGGVAVVVGGLAGAAVAARGAVGDDPSGVLVRLLKAEAVKIAVIVLILWLVFKFFNGLVPLALILGLAGAALLSGAAMVSMNEKSNL